jgi:hypothetical protein
MDCGKVLIISISLSPIKSIAARDATGTSLERVCGIHIRSVLYRVHSVMQLLREARQRTLVCKLPHRYSLFGL